MNPTEINVLVEKKDNYSDMLNRLTLLVHIAQELNNKTFEKNYKMLNPPTIQVDEKTLYWKIIKADNYSKYDNQQGKVGLTGSQSSYCWVRKSDGAILKGDWKKPDTKRVRAYLTDDDAKIASVLTDHGVIYLKGG